jgi:glutamine synthetase type III
LLPANKINSISSPITPTNFINSDTEIKFDEFPRIIKNIDTNENQTTDSTNIIENNIDILKTASNYSIAQCISADLKQNTELSNRITQKYGDMTSILENLELIPGQITTIDTENRTIHYFVVKEKNNSPISYLDIYENLYNLKNASI